MRTNEGYPMGWSVLILSFIFSSFVVIEALVKVYLKKNPTKNTVQFYIPTKVEPNSDGKYHPLSFTEDDIYYATEALYFEAALEPTECQELILGVIVNRLYDSRWENSIKGVIWEKHQFSYTKDGKHEEMLNLDARKRLEKVAVNVLGGYTLDNTKGSLYYYNPSLANPNWDWDKIEFVTTCGGHDFYRDKLLKKEFP